jgi:hypothetical protein
VRQRPFAGHADTLVSHRDHRTLAIRPAALTAATGFVAVAVFLCPGMGLGQAPEELHPVSDGRGRFAISVPSEWRVVQSKGDLPALSAFSSDSPETPPDSVEVYLRDMSAPLSPKECARQMAFAMRMSIGRWTTLSEGPDTLAGLPAYSRTYVWHTKAGVERRSIQICVPVGARIFVIIGTTMNSEDSVAQNFSEVTRIIETFQPGSAPPTPAMPQIGGGK